jgi:molybdopterin converting factor small subunit
MAISPRRYAVLSSIPGGGAVHVQVRFGSGLAAAAGRSRLGVELPHDATVATLIDHLGSSEPAIAAGLRSALPVVRGVHATSDQRLADGDEVALLIPVAGGAGPIRPARRKPWP